ncbi:arginine biosynthesis ArgJ, mitochondrial [Helicocarpus griseus UAMH5409]|uniref:Arginine biosynthesis bifunctional protein ArgJ, mitochondrial n=1 Tax=Helicocarpus griseus UAMH5409 TaxID=1447875 RepID=A0A2B7YAX5_9EURO|nr:arginine biosynthesis ArgJ, mitochondrial [Helicocarpus griseus UAMH5409]
MKPNTNIMKSPQSLYVMTGFVRLPKNKLGQVRHYALPAEIPASKQKYIPSSGTYPKGFVVAGAHAGVKESNTRFPDVALICSETPCSAAAVFTTNKFQAAPVQVSKQVLEARGGEGIRAVVINSGCANAVTGKGGLEDAKSMSAKVDECIGAPSSGTQDTSSLVMSTGVIGQRLPITKILTTIPTAHSTLSPTHASWLTTARAICTTDTFPKLLSTTFTLPSAPNTTYSLAGMTKGAGMIHPNMATLLGVLATDAPITAPALKPLLTHAVSRSFNSISIDGDTSTNDTIALLANGAAGGIPITNSPASADYAAMQKVLTSFAQSLAQLVVRDGEGATKFVTVRVRNSPSHDDAKTIASTIARSPLVKTALYGKDANWGRILCAIGYTQGIGEGTVVPERTSVSFKPVDGSEELKLLVNGEPEAVDEERAARILEDEDLEIVVDLGGGVRGEEGKGGEEGVYWFCDFSHEYVTINGDYRT